MRVETTRKRQIECEEEGGKMDGMESRRKAKTRGISTVAHADVETDGNKKREIEEKF